MDPERTEETFCVGLHPRMAPSRKSIGGRTFAKALSADKAKQMLILTGMPLENIAEIAMKGMENQRWSYGSRQDAVEPLHQVRAPTPRAHPWSNNCRLHQETIRQ